VRPRRARPKHLAPLLFVLPYVVLLALFGVFPVTYAVVLAVSTPKGGFAGINNFAAVIADYRLPASLANVGAYVLIWLAALMVLVVGLALLTHQRFHRFSKVARFSFYLPGALAGSASVLVWMFMLDPTVSPAASLLKGAGIETFTQSTAPGHLAFIFAVIAFWTGAGGWIVIMYGALNNIPGELIEAAQVDGANPFRIAWSIQLPLIRKWIAYMLIISFATGTQLFVEPQLLAAATFGGVSESWSVNQLSLIYAFQYGDFNRAAALNVGLLAIALALAIFVISKVKLFDTEA
jgi:multiple sugar transport system permease protein